MHFVVVKFKQAPLWHFTQRRIARQTPKQIFDAAKLLSQSKQQLSAHCIFVILPIVSNRPHGIPLYETGDRRRA